jgi:hypothetical protein
MVVDGDLHLLDTILKLRMAGNIGFSREIVAREDTNFDSAVTIP